MSLAITPKVLKCAFAAGVFLSAAFGYWRLSSSSSQLDGLLGLFWLSLCLHQFEEYVATELVLGKEFYFSTWFHSVGYDCSAKRAFVVNIVVGWPSAIIASYIGKSWIVIPLIYVSAEFMNAAWHVSMTQTELRWSPGTLSSLFILIPMAFAVHFFALSEHLVSPIISLSVLVIAFLLHFVFFWTFPKSPLHYRRRMPVDQAERPRKPGTGSSC